MKKLLPSFITASLLGVATLSATTFNYDTEFEKMNQFMNSMMQEHFNRAKIGNLGYPRVNLQSTEKSYIYEFDLAGVAKDEIKLTINENNILTLSGQKKSTAKEEKGDYLYQEIFYGSFKKVIQLPEDADQEKLQTKYNNGILTLILPKKELKKSKVKVIKL